MITVEPGLYVRVQELENGPKPFPLQSGFNLHTAYRALGMFNPSETSDAFFILTFSATPYPLLPSRIDRTAPARRRADRAT